MDTPLPSETPDALCRGLKIKAGNGWELKLLDLAHTHMHKNS